VWLDVFNLKRGRKQKNCRGEQSKHNTTKRFNKKTFSFVFVAVNFRRESITRMMTIMNMSGRQAGIVFQDIFPHFSSVQIE
jgi:hypothetical protein